MLLHIAFTKSDEHLIEGSGVMVAPGIALCATHVLSPYMERILKGEMSINCSGISEDGIQIWKVRALPPL